MIEVWNNALTDRELANLNNTIADRNIMEGPVLREFEQRIKDLLQVGYVIGTTSGSAALLLALMGIGIKPGDEVIVPDLTFIATANAAHLLGAHVVVVPVGEGTTLMDEELLEDHVTQRTKAIITVDLNGRIACSERVKKRYSARGIYIIDDACQAFMSCGPDKKMAGTHADIACYSFGISKMVTTVMGGAIATDDRELYDRMKIMKTQGMSCVFEGDAYLYPGFNMKLPDVLASIGLAQLDRLDLKMQHMREIDQKYREGLSGIEGLSFLPREEGEHPWMTDVLCEDKDKVRKILFDNGISSRPLGAPLHTASYLEHHGDHHTSEKMRKKMLYLPSGPNQKMENVERVIEVLRSHDLT